MSPNDNQPGNWQKGLAFFFTLSGWLVGPLVAALIIGKWLDVRYGTRPWLFLAATAVGFVITIVGLTRQSVAFIKESERAAKNQPLNPRDTNTTNTHDTTTDN